MVKHVGVVVVLPMGSEVRNSWEIIIEDDAEDEDDVEDEEDAEDEDNAEELWGVLTSNARYG